jgi:hypothetical protein
MRGVKNHRQEGKGDGLNPAVTAIILAVPFILFLLLVFGRSAITLDFAFAKPCLIFAPSKSKIIGQPIMDALQAPYGRRSSRIGFFFSLFCLLM